MPTWKISLVRKLSQKSECLYIPLCLIWEGSGAAGHGFLTLPQTRNRPVWGTGGGSAPLSPSLQVELGRERCSSHCSPRLLLTGDCQLEDKGNDKGTGLREAFSRPDSQPHWLLLDACVAQLSSRDGNSKAGRGRGNG